MNNNYCSYPTEGISDDLRTVFLYAAPEDVEKLPKLAEKITDPKLGTKCRVKWLNPAMPIDKSDLEKVLSLSQVLIVYVTKSLTELVREMKRKNRLPLPIQFMQEKQKPYFPIADVSGNLEEYCRLDKQIHGLLENDADFASKLKEQLSKFVLDEETISAIREKGIINQIFMSYRKDDVIVAQNIMRQIHDLSDFEAISIWYDRFLDAGKEFNNDILKAVKDSKAFSMVITPNITTKRRKKIDNKIVETDNYVVKKEYPYACEKEKPIIPLYESGGGYNLNELKAAFKNIPNPIDIKQAEPHLRSIFPNLPTIDSYNSERLYYLGRAYLAGYFFEQDSERAVALLKKAAEFEDKYALNSSIMLAEIYNSGNLVERINYDEVLTWCLRNVEISEKIFGKDHTVTATSYNNIGEVYDKKDNYEKALEYYFKALEICKNVLGKDPPNIATSYNNIGLVYCHKGDYEKSLEYYRKASKIYEKIFGKNHPDTAMSYNNIGMIYHHKGDYEKALEYYFKDLEIHEKVLGKDNPFIAIRYNNIGAFYQHKGDYEKTLKYYLKALAIREKVLGKDHPDTATSYNSIGGYYDDKGDYEKALEYYFMALEIREKVLSKNHHSTATSYNNIGMVYCHKGDYEKALEYYFKALDIYENVLGKDHPSTTASYNNIGVVYSHKGDYQKALESYFKILEICEEVLGKRHPNTAMCYNNLGTVYEHKGEYDKALIYTCEAVIIMQICGLAAHPNTQGYYNVLRACYKKTFGNMNNFDNWFQNKLDNYHP
ncbi:MAG: DUF2225 domain-containing protein [Oscillospiraceae bacterium]|jgi:tetratricopeptide (TPR) repeat protein|nr:DUF2225 domain-containing protein [Oscillospiraceae bacterium]